MPRFSPFRGVRYTAGAGPLDALIAPPYDVIAPDDRAALLARNEHNAVRLELPDGYDDAARLWREWLDRGVLAADDTAAFYAYRMTFPDEGGTGSRSTTGVLGALALSDDVLAHEHTTPKDKADRLNLLRATRVNLSPIWALATSPLASSVDTSAPADGRAVDAGGVVHELWRVIGDAAASIADAVGAGPALIADGHHRYEVANAYLDEAGADAPGAAAILTFVVELAPDQLAVRAIHRLLSGLPDGFDVVGALAPHFDVEPTDAPDATILARMDAAGALALVTADGCWLLRPKAATTAAAAHDLDSSRLDVALASLPEHGLVFQHGWDLATAAVEKGDAQAAVLLRPATVDQIAAIAHGGERMPPKTTFFFPKLATGLVFRSLDLDR